MQDSLPIARIPILGRLIQLLVQRQPMESERQRQTALRNMSRGLEAKPEFGKCINQ
jgi:hypothetical protein